MAGDLYVHGGPLLTSPDNFLPSGEVLIQQGRVTYAGPSGGAEPPAGCPRLDARGGLIMPGLVNGHTHGAMTLFRGLADDLPLKAWLEEHMFPTEARWVSQQMVQLCTLLAAAEMLLSGTTTVGDSYFCAHGAARAYEQAGMRAMVAQGLIDYPAPGVPEPAKNLEVCRDFVQTWQGVSPLITPGVFAHSTYTCSAQTLQAAAGLARELGCPLHIHLAESRQEAADCRAQHGLGPVDWLESLGFLEPLAAAVHGAWLEPAEMELLARRGVAMVLCPESNMKLAAGAADAPALLAAGLKVGLGTDGPASNNDLDLLGEVGTCARLAKLRAADPAALPAGAALDLALAGSAAALGLAGQTGRLEPGYAGDLIVLELNQPHLTPLHNPVSHLAYAARGADVRQVVIDGQVVVRDRQILTFDLPQVMAQVRQLAEQVA